MLSSWYASQMHPGLVAISAAMRQVFHLIASFAPSSYPVVLLGPTGVGKGLLARIIHGLSRNPGDPYVVLSGGELTAGLLHNQLFGHVRGAFTGALSSAKGAFEQAAHGTFFMDELHHWGPEVQSALLRVLGDGEVKPIFGTRSIPITCRMVFAADRPLDDLVAQGKLLPDLRYRIGELEVVIPPLTARREDVVPLAHYFLQQLKRANQFSNDLIFEPQVLWQLLSYGWPGNVRELEGVVRRAVLLARDGCAVQIQHLPDRLQSPSVNFEALDQEVRHQLVGWAYTYEHNDRRNAAALLGVHPNTIDYHRKLEQRRCHQSESA